MPKNRMELVKQELPGVLQPLNLKAIPEELTAEDLERYRRVSSIELDREQVLRILSPTKVLPWQTEVLAVHWHPEFVPMDLIAKRIEAMYPNKQEELIIPTQHNEILTWGKYAGVEVDCFSGGFNRKVQLLMHMRADRLEGAHTLHAMLAHTFKYRWSQLFELLDALSEDSLESRRQKAAATTGADAELVQFCAIFARKLKRLIEENWTTTPAAMIKNKLVRNYLDALRQDFGDRLISRAQMYLKSLKKLVKQNFSLRYFYRASEVIEEARSLGAGIVIPHPEQFWPILLADYDVDGYEVWNPQSQEYTEFLIRTVDKQNQTRRPGQRQLLVFMGDDCHMGEKARVPDKQDPEKGLREIGLQPAWEDMAIRKSLILTGASRGDVINEYKARLG